MVLVSLEGQLKQTTLQPKKPIGPTAVIQRSPMRKASCAAVVTPQESRAAFENTTGPNRVFQMLPQGFDTSRGH